MILEGAQESFEPINVIIKGKCMGADPSGTQSTEQRQSTKVHKNIYPRHVKTEKSVPGVSTPFSGLLCWAAQYSAFPLPQILYGTRRGMAAHLSIRPQLAYCFFFFLAIAHGLRCLLLATSGLHGSQLCVNSSLPGCVFLNTGTMFS